MMLYRVTVVLLLVVCGVCGALSSLFPLFTAKGKDPAMPTATKESVYFWYEQSEIGHQGNSTTLVRVSNADRECSEDKLRFVILSATSIVGPALAGIASLIGSYWIPSRRDNLVHVLLAVVAFIALGTYVATIVLLGVAYTQAACSSTEATKTAPLKDHEPKYKFGTGAYLLCAALPVQLIACVLILLNCCLCRPTSSSHRSKHSESSHSHRSSSRPSGEHRGGSSSRGRSGSHRSSSSALEKSANRGEAAGDEDRLFTRSARNSMYAEA